MAPIVEKFPGDGNSDANTPPESIFLPNLAHNISKTLPLLRDLKTVSAWYAAETDKPLEILFEVNLADHATRCRYRGSEQGIPVTDYGHQLPLQGVVQVAEGACPYAGFEMMADDPIFREWHNSKNWPKVLTIDSETGAEQEDREKADSHCAAYFVETPTEDGGSLQIQQVVFLPVGEPKTILCAGKSDFTLMLHGYFFPNAGRTGVDIRDDINNEADIKKRWDYQLYHHGTLPLVVPALERFVKTGKLSEEKVRTLTEALEKSDTFDRCRQSICRDKQWVRRLKASCPVWEQLDNPDEEILEIPAPPNSTPNRPYEVFPNLREIAGGHVITFRGDPRLTTRKKASKWPVELLTQMLDIPVESIFGNRELLKYFVEFLKDCATDTGFDTADILQRLTRTVFNTLAVEQIRANRSEVKNFLALLPSSSCFPISKDIPEEVFRGLFQLKLHVLLVPEDLMPDEHVTQKERNLCDADAVEILKFLSTLEEKKEYANPKSTLVQNVIAASNWDALQTQCHALEIFVAHDYRIKSNVFLFLSQLTELRVIKGVYFPTHLPMKIPRQQIFSKLLTRTLLPLSTM